MVDKTERGRVYENRLHKEGRARKQPASGALYSHKEDLITEHELIQAKSTANEVTYTLYRDDIKNVVRHAMQLKRIGVLFLEFKDEEYVIMRRKDYDNHVSFEELVCRKCGTGDPVVCLECICKSKKQD